MTVDRRDLSEGFLFTDQYQLTMAQLYWNVGMAERRAQFDYFFRRYPDYGGHRAGYAVTAGLGWLLDWVQRTRVEAGDIEVLRAQTTNEGTPRFADAFLDWLSEAGTFESLTFRAVAEGRIVHAGEPIVIVEGPLALAQIIETSLLNHLNYQTLIATKASRVTEQSGGGRVLEFGMRRGPGLGTNAGTRAALIGGADASSNVGVSHSLGVDPQGTHAHSMVQLFMAVGGGELAGFRAYADLYPDECVLLVDTIDTLNSGIPNAIVVFEELRKAGHRPIGIRLDSGDLAHLAVRAGKLLNDAGFSDVAIVLSSDLDELEMWRIREQISAEARAYGLDPASVHARIVYGVGTRLITSHGHPALDGVYKLVGVDEVGDWIPAIKVSDSPDKMPIPGDKRLWRTYDDRGLATADVVSTGGELLDEGDSLEVFQPHGSGSGTLRASETVEVESMLETVYDRGDRTDGSPDLETMRTRRIDDLQRLDPGVRRLIDPVRYRVSVTERVKRVQTEAVAKARP